jgi:hypothetical protein
VIDFTGLVDDWWFPFVTVTWSVSVPVELGVKLTLDELEPAEKVPFVTVHK